MKPVRLNVVETINKITASHEEKSGNSERTSSAKQVFSI
jgi:hypothetical protein